MRDYLQNAIGYCKEKKLFKIFSVYALYVFVAWTFDYIYIPWLAIRFQYFAVIPLYFSLFLISLVGLVIVKYAKEDVLLVGVMGDWLKKESSTEILYRTKERIQKINLIKYFAVSGLWVIVFFLSEKIVGFINYLKEKSSENPKMKFILISVWWGPLHSFLFFEKEKGLNFSTVLKSFIEGSFYCAAFWGLVIDLIVLLWNLFKQLF